MTNLSSACGKARLRKEGDKMSSARWDHNPMPPWWEEAVMVVPYHDYFGKVENLHELLRDGSWNVRRIFWQGNSQEEFYFSDAYKGNGLLIVAHSQTQIPFFSIHVAASPTNFHNNICKKLKTIFPDIQTYSSTPGLTMMKRRREVL